MRERYSRPSPFKTEAPTDKYRDVLDTLQRQVESIHDDESFRRYLDFQSRFHQYSHNNVMLILAQRPEATQVAGFRTWQTMNRYVKKGEQGIKIIFPMQVKTGETNGAGEEAKKTLFRVGYVFDHSQTDGEPLPAPPRIPILEGDAGGVLYAHLAGVAADEKLDLYEKRCLIPSTAQGSLDPGVAISIKENPQLQMTKTLAHEAAHHFTGHHETYGEYRGEHEAVAEATAYTVLKHFGLDSASYSAMYISGWLKDKDRFKQLLGAIQKSSHEIITRVEGRAGIVPTGGGLG